jgi:hypothetical protein
MGIGSVAWVCILAAGTVFGLFGLRVLEWIHLTHQQREVVRVFPTKEELEDLHRLIFNRLNRREKLSTQEIMDLQLMDQVLIRLVQAQALETEVLLKLRADIERVRLP